MNIFKQFKQKCVQDKSTLTNFFKWFSLTLLICLIGIYFGLTRMIKDGSMVKLLSDLEPSQKNDFLIIGVGSYIFLTALFSAFIAINMVLKRK